MKVLVGIKRVLDYKANIRVKPDHSGIDTEHLTMSMNPFDEIALEEAIRLKEKGIAQEIVAVSVGSMACQDTLRQALAMGADRAILIHTNETVIPNIIAHLFKELVSHEHPRLVILGKQAIDDDCNQSGQILAGLLGWALGTCVSRLLIQDVSAVEVIVDREVDQGLETIALRLPAVITADLRLNEPRYITLPNIIKAKNKPLTIKTPTELGMTLKRIDQQILKIEPPPVRQPGARVNSMSELMQILKNKHKLLS